MRILLTSKGTYGDVAPFFALGAALKRQGHEVLFLTHAHYAPLASRAGLHLASLDTEAQYAAFLGDLDLLQSPRGMGHFARKHVFPGLQAELELIASYLTPGTILLARHMGSFAARFAGERMKAPLGSVFTAPSQAEAFPLSAIFEQQVLGGEINEQRRSAGLPAICDWESWHRRPDRFFGCWPSWFARPSASWPEPFVNLGFAYDSGVETGSVGADVEALLRERPVLITGGTGVWQHAREFYAAAAVACRRAKLPALLICRHEQLVPGDLGRPIHWFRELPFGSIMPRVSLVIHHGGAGTSLQAMRSGVPQVILAAGGDRPDNARRLEALRVAVQLPPTRWQPAAVQSAISMMRSSAGVARACAGIREALQADGLQEALTAICRMRAGEPAACLPAPADKPGLAQGTLLCDLGGGC